MGCDIVFVMAFHRIAGFSSFRSSGRGISGGCPNVDVETEAGRHMERDRAAICRFFMAHVSGEKHSDGRGGG